MFDVEGLHAFYGASHVLHGVTLGAAAGELVALLGRNGAGKTTTLTCVMGALPARSGTVRVDGVDVSATPSHGRLHAGLALVPSGARVFGSLSVEENLRVVRPRAVEDGEGWTIERVHEFFPKLGELRAAPAGKLSGGERQMLAVGRGLMANPKVLLLDEPSEGLAPVIVQTIGRLLEELKATGLTIVLAEQNHRFALKHADRAFLIEKGAIQHSAAADELEGSAELQRYLGV